MAEKDLKKLSRLELLEILLDQSKENEQLRAEIDTLKSNNETLRTEIKTIKSTSVQSTIDLKSIEAFSQVAEKIDQSLSETQKATKQYIERLSLLTEYAQKNVVLKGVQDLKAGTDISHITGAVSVEKKSETKNANKPSAFEKKSKRVESPSGVASLLDNFGFASSSSKEEKTPEKPASANVRFYDNCVSSYTQKPAYKVTPIKASPLSAADDAFLTELLSFYFANINYISALPENIQTEIKKRFKR